MAEILIKGMEMPKYCRSCRFEESSIYGQKCCITRKFTRLFNNEDGMERHISCPLVEVPIPHGELCEKDKLKEATKNTVIQNSRGEIYQIGKAIAKMIDSAPTILEAST